MRKSLKWVKIQPNNMTTLKDRINDVFIQYENDTRAGQPHDMQALEMAIMDEIRDFFEKILS